MNQKTLDVFTRFMPLFNESVNNNCIGICKWNEAGSSIDTALPEIRSLTEDKEEWRAIVIRYEDDTAMAAFSSDRRNPYDFDVNKETDSVQVESPVPLIRLTHMLGGLPAPEVRFKPETITEEGRAPRVIYVPVDDPGSEKAYRELSEQYAFDGKMPSSIILISLRARDYGRENNIEDAWQHYRESRSSEFWKRNRYPSVCRFLVYEFETQGTVQRDADEFSFWYTILLLSLNEIDPATVQGYRLYKAKTILNRDRMLESFQMLTARLRDARQSLEKEIRKDSIREENIDDALPNYEITIPVALDLKNEKVSEVDPKLFGLTSDSQIDEVGAWNRRCALAEESLSNAVRKAERVLDQTADRMRPQCVFEEDNVEPLNRYQEEDLLRETQNLYHDIVQIQGTLPKSSSEVDEESEEASEAVRNYLAGRVLGGPVGITIAIAIVLILLSLTPPLIMSAIDRTQIDISLLYVFLGEVALVGLVCLIALIFQKHTLSKLINRYNQLLKSAYNKLQSNASEYSKYMSNIASHSRGHSYIDISNRKKYYTDFANYYKYRHIKAINLLLGKLRVWSRAFYLPVDFESKRPDFVFTDVVDVMTAPSENMLYMFDYGVTYPVYVNNSGMTIDSPYSFAERLELIREELYDNDGNR